MVYKTKDFVRKTSICSSKTSFFEGGGGPSRNYVTISIVLFDSNIFQRRKTLNFVRFPFKQQDYIIFVIQVIEKAIPLYFFSQLRQANFIKNAAQEVRRSEKDFLRVVDLGVAHALPAGDGASVHSVVHAPFRVGVRGRVRVAVRVRVRVAVAVRVRVWG